MLKKTVKSAISSAPVLQSFYTHVKSQELLRSYRARRDQYQSICEQAGLRYSRGATQSAVRTRLKERGYAVTKKKIGEIHTFAFIPRIGWHEHLYPDLQELGPVTEFDYVALGYDVMQWFNPNRVTRQRRDEMNRQFISSLKEVHERTPIDWVFVYASGREISPDTIRTIQDELGIPLVNMCLDDKQSWEHEWVGDHRAGQIDLAPLFDLSWTSARVACGWYLAEGGRPLYLPEGCNAHTYYPRKVPQDIAVSFVGAAYGFRPSAISFLKRAGVPIETYGSGWGTRSIWGDEVVELMCRSRINLGMGGIDTSETLTNVKTRDFEVPCTGGGLYITSFNPDLAQHFDIGREIVCYRSRDEMLELILYYLDRPDEALEIAGRARKRCLAEHRWLHRYLVILGILGIV